MMKTFLVLILTLTGAQCKLVYGPGMVTGLVDHTVTIPCRYEKWLSFTVKSWCKSTLPSLCVKKASTDDIGTDGRVSISDETSEAVFYVTMTSLTKEDEGWYQCVIQKAIFLSDVRHSVYLNVSMEPGAVGPTADLKTSPTAQISDSSVAAVWAVMRWVVFSLMLACFLTVSWWKRSARRESVATTGHTLQGADSTRSRV